MDQGQQTLLGGATEVQFFLNFERGLIHAVCARYT